MSFRAQQGIRGAGSALRGDTFETHVTVQAESDAMKTPLPRVPTPAPAAPFPVIVEVISYVNDMVDAPGQGQKEFTVEARPGDTLRTVLQRFSSGFPRLHEALWDPGTGEIGGHIEVIFNDTILGVRDSLDSEVHAHNRVILLGQYVGG